MTKATGSKPHTLSPARTEAEVAASGRKPAGGQRVIWFVNQYAGSPRHGMEFRHYELGAGAGDAGHAVVVISGSYSHLFTPAAASPRAVHASRTSTGVTYCWVTVPRYGRAISIGRVLNMARLHAAPVPAAGPAGCPRPT